MTILNRRQRNVLRWCRGIGKEAEGYGVTERGIRECEKLGLVTVTGETCAVAQTDKAKKIKDSDL